MTNSRKNRKPFHSKRIIAESEDGWSRVEHTRPTPRRGRQNVVEGPLPPVDASLSVPRLTEEFEKHKQQWVESEARKALEGYLGRHKPQKGWPIRKAFCVALGSPSISWANRLRSVWQFVVFMDVVDMVQEEIEDNVKIQLYAQDPRFTSLDKEFFRSLDIIVLDSPQAEEQMDPSSFMFIPFLEWHHEVPFMIKAKDCPLYITSSLHWVTDAATNRLAQLSNEKERSAGQSDTYEIPTERTLQNCEDTLAASQAVFDTHDEYKTLEPDLPDNHSLSFSVYTTKLID